jgi:class 3 adenylate cyclase
MAGVGCRVAAILDADVVGHSGLTAKDDGRWSARLVQHRVERLEHAVARHGGRVVKLTGDGARAEFPCAAEALSAAIEFQQAMVDADRGQSEDSAVAFRLGLHLGDASEVGDVDAVRPSEAQPPCGGIVISASLRDAVAGRVKASFIELGSAGLGTVERPMRAYEVGWDPADWPAASAAAATPITARGDAKPLGRWAIAITWAVLLMGALYLALAPASAPIGWRAPRTGSLEGLQLERRAEAALAGWQRGEQDEPDDEPANAENAERADAYDGLYAGMVTMRADSRVVTFKVKVTNGIGSGMQSRLDCGTAPLALRIAPSGIVSGMVLIFSSTCLKTELAIRGRAIGGTLQLRLGSQYLELSEAAD